jgi:hypothetical protein
MLFRSLSGRSLRAAALIAVASVALTGCDTLREAAGMNKMAPDEFAVTTKAPLVIPPDFNLRPPRPGAVPINQVDPTDAAEAALFGDPAAAAAPGAATVSVAEQQLLGNSRIQAADPQIRQNLASDNQNMVGADDSFTNSVLFWQRPAADNGQPVNADAEARRADQSRAGQPPAPGAAPGTPPPAGAAPPPPPESSGWFDGWFDWF